MAAGGRFSADSCSAFLSLFGARVGAAAGKQTVKLLAGCAFRTPFLTNLLSVVVFGGIAYELANWHPVVPAGFWDYTQMIVRFSLVLHLISAGVLFWSLSLAGLQVPKQDIPTGRRDSADQSFRRVPSGMAPTLTHRE